MKEVYNSNGDLVEVSVTTPTKNKGGVEYLLTDEEKAVIKAKEDAWSAESVKRNAQSKILKLEVEITPRRTREAILGTDNGWLANQEILIQIERNKLGE